MGKIKSQLDNMIANPPERLEEIQESEFSERKISLDAAMIYNEVVKEYNKLTSVEDRSKFLKAIEVQIGIAVGN